MAHRKPLGSTCSAHFGMKAWERMPECGDYLVSTAGTAYLVVGLREGKTRVQYVLERAAAVPDGSAEGFYVYEFFWLSRDRKSPARG